MTAGTQSAECKHCAAVATCGCLFEKRQRLAEVSASTAPVLHQFRERYLRVRQLGAGRAGEPNARLFGIPW